MQPNYLTETYFNLLLHYPYSLREFSVTFCLPEYDFPASMWMDATLYLTRDFVPNDYRFTWFPQTFHWRLTSFS